MTLFFRAAHFFSSLSGIRTVVCRAEPCRIFLDRLNASTLCYTSIVYYTSVVVKREPMEKKPTIQELEKILNSEETTPIQILPNGEIRPVGQASIAELGSKKP